MRRWRDPAPGAAQTRGNHLKSTASGAPPGTTFISLIIYRAEHAAENSRGAAFRAHTALISGSLTLELIP